MCMFTNMWFWTLPADTTLGKADIYSKENSCCSSSFLNSQNTDTICKNTALVKLTSIKNFKLHSKDAELQFIY